MPEEHDVDCVYKDPDDGSRYYICSCGQEWEGDFNAWRCPDDDEKDEDES